MENRLEKATVPLPHPFNVGCFSPVLLSPGQGLKSCLLLLKDEAGWDQFLFWMETGLILFHQRWLYFKASFSCFIFQFSYTTHTHTYTQTHTHIFTYAVLCLVIQSCPTLWDPIDSSLTGSSVCGDSPGKNIEVDCHALLQGTFSSQGLSQGLPPRKQILCCLIHQGSPYNYSRISWKGRS